MRKEQANETESVGISTVCGVAVRRRRRRCSLATLVLLVTVVRNAVAETAAAAIKILMRRIGERCSIPCAKYHFKHKIAVNSSSNVYRETFRDTLVLYNPAINRRTIINHVAIPEGKQWVGTE